MEFNELIIKLINHHEEQGDEEMLQFIMNTLINANKLGDRDN